MNRKIEISTCKFCVSTTAGHQSEGGHAIQREGFEMIAAKKEYDLRFGGCEYPAGLAHRGDGGIELRRIFVRRVGKQLRRMCGRQSSDDLSHRDPRLRTRHLMSLTFHVIRKNQLPVHRLASACA